MSQPSTNANFTYSRAEAKVYIARAAGWGDGEAELGAAGESLQATIRSWEARHNWGFALKEVTNIAITATVRDYVLWASGVAGSILAADDYGRPAGTFLTTLKYALDYKDLRDVPDRGWDEAQTGSPVWYSIVFDTDGTGEASGSGKRVLRLWPTPVAGDTLTLRYYRTLSVISDPVDWPDKSVLLLLDAAAAHLVERVRPDHPALGELRTRAEMNFQTAVNYDVGLLEDQMPRWVSRHERGYAPQNGRIHPGY